MAVTTGYNHIDVAKIESYGCWCVKLGSGQNALAVNLLTTLMRFASSGTGSGTV